MVTRPAVSPEAVPVILVPTNCVGVPKVPPLVEIPAENVLSAVKVFAPRDAPVTVPVSPLKLATPVTAPVSPLKLETPVALAVIFAPIRSSIANCVAREVFAASSVHVPVVPIFAPTQTGFPPEIPT